MDKDVKIKVCGLGGLENTQKIVALGVDLIGLIFYNKSQRFVSQEAALGTGRIKSLNVDRVGVFVNESNKVIADKIDTFNLQFVQLHGRETPEQCAVIRKKAKVIKAFGVDDDFNFDRLNAYVDKVDFFLFDTKTELHGGSGKKFDWKVLENYVLDVPFFLSGGISIDDVESLKTMDIPSLFALDINSKFEIEPRLKNVELVEEFIQKIRS